MKTWSTKNYDDKFMPNYKNWFKSFLKKHGFLPLIHWKRFELEHDKKAILRVI